MVKKKLVLYVALAALWGACGNDNESQPTAAPDGRTALNVKGEIGTKGASVSRAIDTDWGSNDKIGIFKTGFFILEPILTSLNLQPFPQMALPSNTS